ncbi:hypothetical protein JQ597_13410 [Bradyrhizobium sp. AUGA SZCCT0177]|uniref:hypothetical protein n=1 Tax=Bradyrhizobium sp. AUGA SZCCT0177 TaxID=2807665 RepID=UPI001BA52480|nr:hypothetical protein [Bradyrhizobium sp. AUGA SZCCT0177]MBR1283038.1 hypothetical protein [Bradyrhizobium sp. AUGA SZCCT0177]
MTHADFIGGSDAGVIMGKDEKALARFGRKSKVKALQSIFSRELIVQLGLVPEDLNRRWYETRRIA